jgi:septal ring factor EnvC (AmiA/AmiB activator)
MLPHFERFSLTSPMVGLLVLVVTGVALAVVVDQRLKSSSERISLEGDTAENSLVLEALRLEVSEARDRLGVATRAAKEQEAQWSAVNPQLDELRTRVAELEASKAILEDELPELKTRFAEYRSTYRNGIRNAARGERHPSISTRGGMEYHDTTILRVTDAGLEISHSSGSARIASADLPAQWQERFRWNEDPRRIPEPPDPVREVATAEPDPLPPAVPTSAKPIPPSAQALAKQENLRAIYSEISLWTAKIVNLREEIEQGHNAMNSGQKSVPRTLQTWAERVRQLETELEQANQQLARSRAKLAALRTSSN